MSSDEVDKKNEEEVKETPSSADEEIEDKDNKGEEEEKPKAKAGGKKKGAESPKIKQPAKKRVKTDLEEEKKKDSEADEEEGSDEEDGKVPLLDQPLEVSGRRKRSIVQRFKPVDDEEESNKEVKIPEGKGTVLADMDKIEQNIQKTKPEDLKMLHRFCFNKVGKANEVKKNLKKFNGFEFDKDSKEFEAKLKKIKTAKVTIPQLKITCGVLCLEKSGSKDELLTRIMEFLCCPEEGEKGSKSAKKPPKASAKKSEKAKPKAKGKGRGRKKKTNDSDEEEDEEEEKDDDESEEEKDIEENGKETNNKEHSADDSEADKDDEKNSENEDEKEEVKKDKKEEEDKKAPPKKRAAAKKPVEKNSDSEDAKEDGKSEDDEPLQKKSKSSPPSDDEIKTYIKGLLDGADLEQITMKKVCQDVYDHYPEVDLTHKKDFIKTTVKNIISS